MRGNPSLFLSGKVLQGYWTVGESIPMGRNVTGRSGGNFSVAYKLTGKKGEQAFLKALDYSWAMKQTGRVAQVLQAMTAAYLFECEVLNKCRERRLDRIVHAIATGEIEINEPDAEGVVEYIIFDLADGDLRKYLEFSEKFDLAWRLRTIHSIAVALKQLHGSGIYHQDLKPSNVLVFAQKDARLGDLGRAVYEGHTAAHYNYPFAGDPTYAPPDLAYLSIPADPKQWRLSCDIYHLGSMIIFFFTDLGMTPLIMRHLDPSLHPRIHPYNGPYTGTYEEVKPALREAYDRAVIEFSEAIKDETLRPRLTRIVRELCDPDPDLRGHPTQRNPNGNTFSLERYLSEFDLLARRAEAGIYKE